MSYKRNAIAAAAAATIVISLSAALPGTQPAPASEGLAGIQDRATSHRSPLQVPSIEATPAIETVPTTTITADTDELMDMAEWALEQMEEAGLELPPVAIYMHSDRADCSATPGQTLNGYHTEIDGHHVVHSCGSRWTILHELAHVWDDHELNDHDRANFLEQQGLTDWHADSWYDSGAEHLASIVAWAIDGTYPSRIGTYSIDHLTEVYEQVTGTPLPTDDAPVITAVNDSPDFTTAILPEAGLA